MEKTCRGMYCDKLNGVCSILVNGSEVMCVYLYRGKCDNQKREGEMARDPNKPDTYGVGEKICGQRVK